jgi:hypothetical protein
LQLKKVRGFLSQSPVPISQIALATGFISQVHFPIVSEVNIANLPRHSYKVGGRDCFTNAVNLVWHKAKSAVYWRTPSQR